MFCILPARNGECTFGTPGNLEKPDPKSYPCHSNNSSHNVGIGRPHASRSMYSRLVDRMSLLQYKAPSCHTVLIQYASKCEEEPGNESACNSSIASANRSVVPKLLVVGWCLQPGLLCLGRNSFLAFSCKSLIYNTSYWCLHNVKST